MQVYTMCLELLDCYMESPIQSPRSQLSILEKYSMQFHAVDLQPLQVLPWQQGLSPTHRGSRCHNWSLTTLHLFRLQSIMSSVQTDVINTIVDVLGVDASEVTMSATFEQLDATEIDMDDLVTELEQKFDMEIPED